VDRLIKLLTFVIALFAANSAFAASINRDDVRVIDGDTQRGACGANRLWRNTVPANAQAVVSLTKLGASTF
jgi:hypothetical protein